MRHFDQYGYEKKVSLWRNNGKGLFSETVEFQKWTFIAIAATDEGIDEDGFGYRNINTHVIELKIHGQPAGDFAVTVEEKLPEDRSKTTLGYRAYGTVSREAALSTFAEWCKGRDYDAKPFVPVDLDIDDR